MTKRILFMLACLATAAPALAQTTVSTYPEDTASVSGERVVMMGVRRCDTTPTSSSATAGDRVTFCADANGRIYVNGSLYTPAGDSAMDDTANAVKSLLVDASGAALTTDTQVTHATSIGTITSATGGLVMCNASTATPTDVGADGDAAIPWCTRNGALNVVVTSAPSTTVTATNLDVQSGGADLATQTTVAAIQTAVELIDNDQTGWTPAAVTSAATNNSTNVKASAGRVSSISVINTTATLYYLRLYNLAAAPTCSSATGFLVSLPIPASTTGAGLSISFPNGGIAFDTGIGYCITAGSGGTDNTSAATGLFGLIAYK